MFVLVRYGLKLGGIRRNEVLVEGGKSSANKRMVLTRAPFHGAVELFSERARGSYQEPINSSPLPEMRGNPKGTHSRGEKPGTREVGYRRELGKGWMLW